ncbi:MAG: glycosyltransferase [Patescibacteria group bacterium]|nr:glycosyltransferase [Patescibacteria group bacterium]MCL5224216.1 glycosyltransferase [Patescibacteria group bacterium]
MKLSVLICSLSSRGEHLAKLLSILFPQIQEETEIIVSIDDGGQKIGVKRNRLMASALGQYVCFIDDDDEVSDDYIAQIMTGIESGADHVAIGGIMTTNGREPHEFRSSKDYVWHEKDGVYYRGVQHLGVIKRDLVLQCPFPPISFGEDREFSERVTPLIKTEYQIQKPIYFYRYRNPKC